VPLGFSALPLFFSSEKNNHPFQQFLLKKERIMILRIILAGYALTWTARATIR
jgi:hypothetical protein